MANVAKGMVNLRLVEGDRLQINCASTRHLHHWITAAAYGNCNLLQYGVFCSCDRRVFLMSFLLQENKMNVTDENLDSCVHNF